MDFVWLGWRFLYGGAYGPQACLNPTFFFTPSNAHPYEEVHRRTRNFGRRYPSSFSASESDGEQRQRDGRREQGATIDLICVLIFPHASLPPPLDAAVVALILSFFTLKACIAWVAEVANSCGGQLGGNRGGSSRGVCKVSSKEVYHVFNGVVLDPRRTFSLLLRPASTHRLEALVHTVQRYTISYYCCRVTVSLGATGAGRIVGCARFPRRKRITFLMTLFLMPGARFHYYSVRRPRLVLKPSSTRYSGIRSRTTCL